MLTKQEREEIAERFRNYDKAEYVTLYSGMYDGLLGEHVPKETTVKKDRMELASRILELCDTSNMLELPVDKDGEVICPGDTVYVDDDMKYKVAGYMMRGNSIEVILTTGTESVYTKESADDITHKKPGTTAALSEQIRNVIDKGQMTAWAMAELFNIVDQLESLSDKDE
jgi:hypothetical protein|nr:MAG TPA: hypothetical protein [Caudoviricetes sp.]